MVLRMPKLDRIKGYEELGRYKQQIMSIEISKENESIENNIQAYIYLIAVKEKDPAYTRWQF